ncbi:hypothetical protein [Haliangium sp.]|uniref:hypothetical protein n=1 Tax=Haliangium sp. TaxID=2663208 RepID=UPI003D0C094A
MRAWIFQAALAAILASISSGCGEPAAVSRALGARCERHGDCDERCLGDDDQRYPDGFCSLSCDRHRDCPAGAVCAAVAGGVCLFACDAPEACAFLGPEWTCMTQPARSLRADDPPREVQVCLGQ